MSEGPTGLFHHIAVVGVPKTGTGEGPKDAKGYDVAAVGQPAIGQSEPFQAGERRLGGGQCLPSRWSSGSSRSGWNVGVRAGHGPTKARRSRKAEFEPAYSDRRAKAQP